MAHSTVSKAQWVTFFADAGIPADESDRYAATFVTNRISDAADLTSDLLKEMGVTVIGDAIAIMKQAKQKSGHRVTMRMPNVSTPHIKAEMTPAEFRKFIVDWEVYRKIAGISDDQHALHVYNACDSAVQNTIVNTADDFFKMDPTDILTLLQGIVTKKSNPTVHRLAFSNLCQSETEPVKDYVVRLKSAAKDCEFECPNCNFDLEATHVKDQLIRGLHNSTLQTDILAKAPSLKTVSNVENHAAAFEAALADQSKLNPTSEVMQANTYNKKRLDTQTRPRDTTRRPRRWPCSGCGSQTHGTTHADRVSKCPAWGKTCRNCDNPNHYATACRMPLNPDKEREKTDTAAALIAQVEFNEKSDCYSTISAISDTQEIPMQLTPTTQSKSPAGTTNTALVFPDSGASICLASPQHLQKLGVDPQSLIPSTRQVKAVGGSILTCQGWLHMKFQISDNSTIQPLYICDKIDRIYFSKRGCVEVNILPKCFPYPMNSHKARICEVDGENSKASSDTQKPASSTRKTASSAQKPTSSMQKAQTSKMPRRPATIPFPPVEDSVPKLKKFITDSFAEVFKMGPGKQMKTEPVHIHLRKDAIPSAIHVPIPVPINWKKEIKAQLDQDVTNGIIEQVPIGEPVSWCHQMIVVQKKGSNKPRRTVHLKKMNSQCLRETHHCPSPFRLACQVPANTKKTVFDATDGYHSIELDEQSRPLTTFITEWGRYRYRRLPQGFIAAGDAYTRRYDEIIKDVQNKIKCVDDTLLYDSDIESAFYRAWDYLQLCMDNGITINENKFQFCQDTAMFAGLKITPDGIQPSDHIIGAIANFPIPNDISGARAWFGLVNQIAWAYANAPAMQPFRDLVKPNAKFEWNANLQQLFDNSKNILIKQSIEGIQTFDPERRTCLQTDWSKEGIGYLLLQQHCQCEIANAPICCKDGWKLVFAGSRFTLPAETRYSPTEGEALAVAWSLEHAKFFVLGCKHLLVSTDHRSLTGILQDRDLGTIKNPRILSIKERTLQFSFRIQYNPGKWHRAPDALSRNPTPELQAIISESANDPASANSDSEIFAMAAAVITDIGSIDNTTKPMITITDISIAAANDPEYSNLTKAIQEGFPLRADPSCQNICSYWNVRDNLSMTNGVATMNGRIIIPLSLRARILKNLHAAHQGVSKCRRGLSKQCTGQDWRERSETHDTTATGVTN